VRRLAGNLGVVAASAALVATLVTRAAAVCEGGAAAQSGDAPVLGGCTESGEAGAAQATSTASIHNAPTAPPSGASIRNAPAQPPGDASIAAPPAAEAAAPRGEPAMISPAAQGERELKLAEQLLNEGEGAPDDATRRAKYEQAKQHATRAVELLPNSADAHFVHFGAVGRLAQLDGMASAALQLMTLNAELDEVLRLDPNHANALAARGGMLVKLPRLLGGNTKQGIEYLERAVALDHEAVGKRLELAEAYHLVRRNDDAKATADRALAMAQEMKDAERIETCQKFIAELQRTCDGCAMAAIGR
jgi:tetratricopeptide (TPR) repeat protein